MTDFGSADFGTSGYGMGGYGGGAYGAGASQAPGGEPRWGPEPEGYGLVRCPECLEELRYDENNLYIPRGVSNDLERLDLSQETNTRRRSDLIQRAFQRCPNPDPAVEEHFLSTNYLTNGTPITVAFVGESGTGKTHLLASMISGIDHGALDTFGMLCRPVNSERHEEFLADTVRAFQAGRMISGTESQTFVKFTDALLFSVNGVTRPVAFFDIQGEDYSNMGDLTRFLLGVDAFVFVVDAVRALKLPHLIREQERLKREGKQPGIPDRTFSAVLDRITPRDGRLDVAAAVVLNKCDLLRFESPVDYWLRDTSVIANGRLDPRQLYEESRDVYAFLYRHGAQHALRPFSKTRRCTLHFVSATGTSPVPLPPPPPRREGSHGVEAAEARGWFPGGVRPQRVLDPLMSLLAMCGLLDSAEPGTEGGW
ncbi:TRAFAC clade GTPase domain-containing protein [Wenjunlia tyrosinilytica]|uniref:Double-GTPase 2 domain-containing protein n=1 Tax=Wenjunlia tyrosinilytica TaxID=1544741 RepID=A0A918DU95_9ACTN|nr:hypothetical protein [Wenjunlia tyrosinilytica]GGO84186.1 hypothetical protein GCM10012280_15080 [Wenjunlia tyrosinilytica]